MMHAWTYFALLVVVAATAGGGVAYYYGFGQVSQQFTVPLSVQVDGVSRGGTSSIAAITVNISYSTASGLVRDSRTTDAFGRVTFYIPTNTHVTITDSLAGLKIVNVGTSGQSVVLYHVWYTS